MGQGIAFTSMRAIIGAAFVTSATFTLVPACSGGDDFTAMNTGGSSSTGGSAGDSGTTGGKGGTGGNTGGSAGTAGTGGSAGSAGSAGSGGSAGSAGTDGGGGTGGNPGGKPDGQPCANKTECKSGYCVDDVCCESDCKGECRTCKASGKEGLCTPYALDTDPEGECKGAGAATDPCAGKCDGKSACKYPDATKTCSAQVCSSSVQSNFACNSAGACVKADKSCGNYVCSGATCLATCTVDTQCIATAYCKGPGCDPKLDLGNGCSKPSACKSGICFNGTCCNASCGTNFECSSGTCKCNGQTCDAGQACVPWYQDSDGDGFGNAASSILGCANKKPTGYVADKTDCYDSNKDAKPGQTQWFTANRGDGSFDYNCDATQERYYKIPPGGACQWCEFGYSKYPDAQGNCTNAGFGCYCTAMGCVPGWQSGLTTDAACGTTTTLSTCKQDKGLEQTGPTTWVAICLKSASPQPSTVTQPCR